MLPGPGWSPHSGHQVKSEPRWALCQSAVSSGIPSDHDVVNIAQILHLLPSCLSRVALHRLSRPVFFFMSANTTKVWFEGLVLIFYIQLKAGRIMKMRLTGTEHYILNTPSESDPSWKAMIKPNWSLTISQPKIIRIRVKNSPEILVQADVDVWPLLKTLTSKGGSKCYLLFFFFFYTTGKTKKLFSLTYVG